MHAASIIFAILFISQIPFYKKLINQARLYTKTCTWLVTSGLFKTNSIAANIIKFLWHYLCI